MKIIEPSYTIFKLCGEKDPLTKIGRCIQSLEGSKDDPGQNAVLSLLQEHIRKGEEHLLELGDLAFDIRLDSESPMTKLFERQPSGLNIDRIEKKRYILSGHIRALRDLCRAHRDLKVVKALLGLLRKDYEPLFIDMTIKYRPVPLEGLIIDYAANKELEALPLEFKIRHLYLAAHLKASIYAVQELISGCRISSYALQKQINRDKPPELCCIKPPGYSSEDILYGTWVQAINEAEKAFLALADSQNANKNQSVLPLALQRDLVINTSLLEWMRIFKFGIRKDITSEIYRLILSIFKEIKQISPDVFGNIILPDEI